MKFNTTTVEGLDIFYREAGDARAPKLVLLHGYPASSHQYRNLIPALAGRFHVIAPDYPGFGNSAAPAPRDFAYTFDHLAEITDAFLAKVGFTAAWDGLRHAYWEGRTPEVEKQLEAFMDPATVKQIYLHGHKRPELISPDNWNMDAALLARPNQRQIQLDLFYDYRTNVGRYAEWQEFLKKRQPKTIIFWGQDDLFFTREGGEAYLRDLPRAEMHRLDSGHFAVEDHASQIAEKMISFHTREVS